MGGRTVSYLQLAVTKLLYISSFSKINGGIVDVCCVCVSCSVVYDSVRPYGLYPARLFCPWNFPDKNTGVGSHSLLQRIFPTQGLNHSLPALQVDSLLSEPPGKPVKDNTEMNKHDCIPINLYPLTKQAADWIWQAGYVLPTPGVDISPFKG